MSGDAEIPPTYYFSGISFNPSFYQSSSTDYLTLETAKSSFLTYPTAQGSETIATLNTGTISSSGLINADGGLTVPSGKAMTASGTLVASIGTISGNTSIVSFANNTISLVSGSYNINLLVILTGNNTNKTITLMNPIANQNIIFRARMTGSSSANIQANGGSSIIYPIGLATTPTTALSSTTSSLRLISDGTSWYSY